ncbi:DUF4124 domain-containing protein [Ottowia testudinis]|uniref:DUF4124 domain-containing protein n=1 Tax=Ottowia testudinis TaxID=2816950 RepID=A0A975H2C7_9BURK|nr:DUF4124 domain-containing protein [Ottowia testudinis]QTD44733.1 DUF4124 domain-containing protein [Ottowia testudinis]
MIRPVLLSFALALPLMAGAQAIKCTDPATGKTLYTDQPCKGGAVVVPRRTAEEVRQDAEAAAARERALQQREDAAWQREQQRLAAPVRVPEPAYASAAQAESDACRAARAEAAFRAGSFSASPEEIRTARYNAALACGQQPPADIVVVQPYAPVVPQRRPYPHPHPYPYPGHGDRVHPPGWGDGFGMPRPAPARPRYEPGTEPVPVLVRPPTAR